MPDPPQFNADRSVKLMFPECSKQIFAKRTKFRRKSLKTQDMRQCARLADIPDIRANLTLVPPRFRTTWHHTAVSLFAMRAGLAKPRPPSKASQQTPMELPPPTPRPIKAANDASLKERKPGKPSIKRAQRNKPVQKAPRSAIGPIQAGQGRSVTNRKPPKSSASVPVKRRRIQWDAPVANAARLPRKPAQQSRRGKLPSSGCSALPSSKVYDGSRPTGDR
jgi:hypothetical protein